jgi:hypothetical protein
MDEEVIEELGDLIITPQNCVDELIKIEKHCKDAYAQLEQLLNLPYLEDQIKQTPENAAGADPELKRIMRVSKAAAEGYLLDKADLLQTLSMLAETFANSDIAKIENELTVQDRLEEPLVILDKIKRPLELYENLVTTANEAIAILEANRNNALRT